MTDQPGKEPLKCGMPALGEGLIALVLQEKINSLHSKLKLAEDTLISCDVVINKGFKAEWLGKRIIYVLTQLREK